MAARPGREPCFPRTAPLEYMNRIESVQPTAGRAGRGSPPLPRPGRRMSDRRPTIDDVARGAGVSKATVSAVLNDKGTVGHATRERVVAVINQLNYRPTNPG